ncbi:MAG: hypothetical protein CSB34_00395 [Desulfobulbus propionicus]|nr:MAG: hypothetical protein CSB34_00395 [Desulfobulbus propionicus]
MILSLEDLYQGSVASRLEIAQRVVNEVGPQLKTDDGFNCEFALLKQYADDLNAHMTHMDMGSLCAKCAATPSGGCCSLYMSNETDALQLAMNMLAGIEVRFVRDDGEQCCFLGEKGCLFLFKPMFCLNYNCRHIVDAASPEELGQLESLAGKLLGKQYQVEQYLLGQVG